MATIVADKNDDDYNKEDRWTARNWQGREANLKASAYWHDSDR
jgi:hypothetical protein